MTFVGRDDAEKMRDQHDESSIVQNQLRDRIDQLALPVSTTLVKVMKELVS